TAETEWTPVEANEQRGAGAYRFLHKGSDDLPQLFEVRMGPNEPVNVHAHCEAEIIYIVAGSLQFGRHFLTSGSSVSIPGEVLYSFRSGHAGVHYVNFRGRTDLSKFDRSQFEQLRRLEGAAREGYIQAHLAARKGGA